jgi:polyhydroxyalkanoate synthase
MKQNTWIYISIQRLLETWTEITQRLLLHPEQFTTSQTIYWQDYLKLYENIPHPTNPFFDKRFRHPDWQENYVLSFIKQSYLLLSQHLDQLIQNISKDDEKIAQKLRFFTRQFLDAVAPTNFANLNPDVIAKTIETQGANLLNGLKQFLEDIEKNGGQFDIKITDTDYFKLGTHIACTPGQVVYQNDLMQLIHYQATTTQTHACPLLMIPPWINKYYILDLQPENSLVKWLLDQGISVFMISWVNPSSQQRHKQFSDYLIEGPLAAIKIIQKITKSPEVNIAGYCIGGTLLACLLAYAAKKNISAIRSATFLTTLLDFSEPGELGTFIDDKQVSALEELMKTKGYLDGHVMATVFNALRANDLVWSSYINQYLKGEKPKPFDLLYWNSDSTNIPEHVHSFYLRTMYLQNQLIQPDCVNIAGVPLDLSQIKTPSYFVAAQDDHIIPWKSAYKSHQILGGSVKFVLTASGHVAGVVNPPGRQKYNYWTNHKKYKNPEKYLANATSHPGSWWSDWIVWLKQYSGDLQPARDYATKAIEDAPGSYVKVRLADIMAMEIMQTQDA